MANINPFLSKPDAWAKELDEIKSQREKLTRREEHLKAKLSAYAREQNVENTVEAIIKHFSEQKGQ